MKTLLIVTFLLLLLGTANLNGQEKTIRLNLKEGYRYVFERLYYNYVITKEGDRDSLSLEKKVVQCDVEKIIPDEQVIIKVCLKENFRKNPARRGFHLNYDQFFPDFSNSNAFNNFFEEMLCRVNLRYALNLKTRKAELLNKAELLDQFREIMIQKERDEQFAETTIQLINQDRELENARLVSYLLWFHNAIITPDNQVKNSVFKGKPIVVERSEGPLQFSKNELEKIGTANRLQKFRIDTVSGLITNYLTLSYNPKPFPNFEDRIRGRTRNGDEIRINLISSGRIQPDLVFMAGKIEKPLSRKLYISYLQKPFGDELQKKTVYLDENGTFSTDFAFSQSGFIYVENDNPNKNNPPATFVFYAEPGDSFRFQAKGNKLPWAVTFSGDRTNENKLLSELRSQIKITDQLKGIGSWSHELLDRDIYYQYIVDIQNRKVTGGENVGDLIRNLDKSEKIIGKYKSLLSDHSYEFIINELQAFFCSGMFRFLWSSDSSFFSTYMDQTDKDQSLLIKNYVVNLDIQSIFNDYGLYSRRLVNNYLVYNFDINNKTRNYIRTGPNIRFSYDTDQKIQFARMILSGSPLYREIAFALTSHYGYIPMTVDRNDSAIHRELIHRNLDLMLRRCNDNEFVNEISRVRDFLLKSQVKNFVPEASFFNTKGELVGFRNYFGTKPSIFHISRNWSGDRFNLDKMTTEYPEINFIMVVEGNNFREWIEYLKAAESVADQLLLKNDTINLRDLFIRNNDFFIVYDKHGNLQGYEIDLNRAIDLAKNSMISQKISLNPEQLRIIIRILIIVLIVFLIVMLGWRWRVRQRFRKEEQKRRLRELELTAIRSQMNPHFLFNSLNSVQNLIQQNRSQEANQYLADFAGLIRKVLRNSEKEEISLAEELETVSQYLSLEKLRFEFDFSVSVAEGIDPQNTMVPSMLIQPFAENAIVHGLQNKPENRKLTIMVSKNQEGIKIIIEDNGIGREAALKFATGKNGKGSKLMKERLEILREKQGERYRLEIVDIRNEGATGTRVEILIPEEK